MGERAFLDQYPGFHVYWMLLRPTATPEQQHSLGNRMCWWVKVNAVYLGGLIIERKSCYYVDTRYQIPYDTIPVILRKPIKKIFLYF